MSNMTLINSPKVDYGNFKTEFPNELNNDKSYPIGLLMVSAALKQTNKFDVGYVDANFYHMDYDTIVSEVDPTEMDHVGMNVTFPNIQMVSDLSDLLKKNNPDLNIIIGGPAATLASEYLLKNDSIDYVVMGEGEKTIVELLNRLDEGRIPFDVEGIAYKRVLDNNIIRTPGRSPANLSELSLIDVDNIPKEIKKYSGEITLITSRGCQASCSFCSTPEIWGRGRKNLRTSKIKKIDAEINNYRTNGFEFDSVHFLDDNFTNSWEQVKEFTDYWKNTHKSEGITWRCLSRVRAINSQKKNR